VVQVLDIHCWSLNEEKAAFTATITTRGDHMTTLKIVTKYLQEEYELFHTTI